jgi:protein phosphatase PTC2/3
VPLSEWGKNLLNLKCNHLLYPEMQVFDGHGGTDAACFVRKNLLKFIVEDMHFPTNVEKAIRGAFLKADHALADSHSLDNSSGTTALTALIFGR